jgi:hypothetical protein
MLSELAPPCRLWLWRHGCLRFRLRELNQGTTVKIYLPRLIGSARDEANEPDQMVVGAEEAESILLVEDDADLRTYLADVLRGLDYRVIAAPSAEAAKAEYQTDQQANH